MKFHGLTLEEGSTIANMTVASGTAFPSNANEGELYFRSDSSLAVKGLYIFGNGSWDRVASTESLTIPTGVTLPTEFNTGDVYYLNTNDAFEGLYVYTGSAWDLAGGGGGTGTVSSVALALPSFITVSGSPVTTTGTLTGTLASQTANTFFAAPNGSAGAPTFRTIATADVPTLNQNTTGSAATLATSRNFSISGDATASAVAFNGSAAVDLAVTLASIGAAGTFGSASSVPVFDTDAKGRVTTATDTAIAIAASQTTSGTFADARIAASNVTQHQASLTITEAQITDGSILARTAGNETVSGTWTFSNAVTIPATPSLGTDAASKSYVDTMAGGLTPHESVVAATTTNITLSGAQTIDGIAVVAGNRVLVKNQSTASENGIYVASASAWARASDFDGSPTNEVTSGDFVYVSTGTMNGGSGWVLITTGTIVIGTTGMTFSQVTSAGSGVSTFSGGSTGLTPSVATNGAVTLGGTLAIASGGTGATAATGTGNVVLNTSPSIASPTFSGTVTFGANVGNIRGWTATDTDIDALAGPSGGASSFGTLFEGQLSGHFTIGLRSNDSQDSFQVLSYGLSGSTYTVKAFEVVQDGAITWAGVATGDGSGITALNATNVSSGTLAGTYGGTGADNTGKAITVGGNFTTTGAFNTTFAQGASVTLTLPTTTSTLATTGNLSQFAATTSAQLAGIISDETGSGSLVFSASPTMTGIVNVDGITMTSNLIQSHAAMNITAPAAGATGTLHQPSASVYRSGMYQVQITQGSVYEVLQLAVVHNGTTAFVTEFGRTSTSTPTGVEFNATISGGLIVITWSGGVAGTTIKSQHTLFTV